MEVVTREGFICLLSEDRLMAAMEFFNQDPVAHTWTYKLDKAA
jgi:hypothetical protein